MFRREFVNTVYGTDITLCVCPLDEFREWIEREYPTHDFSGMTLRNSSGKTYEHEFDNGICQWFVWLPEWKGTREEVLTLSHESQHVAIRVLRYVGVVLCEQSEEAFTYLAEGFFRALWKELDRYAAKEKPRRNRRTNSRQGSARKA